MPRAHRDDKHRAQDQAFRAPHPMIDAHVNPRARQSPPWRCSLARRWACSPRRCSAPPRRSRRRASAACSHPPPSQGQARLPSMHAVLAQDERKTQAHHAAKHPASAPAAKTTSARPRPPRPRPRRAKTAARRCRRQRRRLLLRRRLRTGMRRRRDADAPPTARGCLPGSSNRLRRDEAECEEAGARCGLPSGSASGEQVCEASSGDRSSSVREGEGEGRRLSAARRSARGHRERASRAPHRWRLAASSHERYRTIASGAKPSCGVAGSVSSLTARPGVGVGASAAPPAPEKPRRSARP